jgi:hypothetical protein
MVGKKLLFFLFRVKALVPHRKRFIVGCYARKPVGKRRWLLFSFLSCRAAIRGVFFSPPRGGKGKNSPACWDFSTIYMGRPKLTGLGGQ